MNRAASAAEPGDPQPREPELRKATSKRGARRSRAGNGVCQHRGSPALDNRHMKDRKQLLWVPGMEWGRGGCCLLCL